MRRCARLTALGGMVLLVSILALTATLPTTASDVTIDLAIDVDTTGNEGNALGATESCNETPLEVGETIDIDIVVRGIPAWVPGTHTGILGMDLDFLFDPAVMHVANVQSFRGPTILRPPGPGTPPYSEIIDYNWNTDYAPPGVTGDTFISMLNFSPTLLSGDGVLVRVTLQAVGAGKGQVATRYTLLGLPYPQIYAADIEPYAVNESGATIVVGDGDCSAPTPTIRPFVTPTFGPTPHTEPTPTPNPHPPTVKTAIDVDTQGNSDNALGPTESCNATPLEVGETIDVDVVVRDVPAFQENTPYTGILGFEFDLLFDPAVLHVTNVEGLEGPSILKATAIASVTSRILYNNGSGQSPPGITGDTLVSIVTGSFQAADGDGVLTRVTLEAIHQGVSRLSLDQTLSGESIPGIYESTSFRDYPVDDTDAAIVVGAGDCPTPTPTPAPTAHPTPTPTPTVRPPTPTLTAAPSMSPSPSSAPTGTARPTITPKRLPETGGPPGVESSMAYSAVALLGVGAVMAGAFVLARRRL